MVTKSKKADPGKKKRIKVLKLDKETIKDLTKDQAMGIRGASLRPSGPTTPPPPI
jgi:hypothetical protein